MKINILFFFLLFSTAFSACAQRNGPALSTPSTINYSLETIVPDLRIPWGMAFLPDGSLLIAEKSGVLLHFKDGVKQEIKGLPDIYVRGQGGFMDLELHPKYSENGWIYMSYGSTAGSGSGGNTAIMRARLDGNQLIDQEVLYKGSPNSTSGNHFGSRIEFDNDGYLYFSIGDRFNRDVNPQSLNRDGGKIYRLHDDGRIPEDNPFVKQAQAKKAIYSYGHRNPQGMTKHPETGQIWIHEHGPRGGDEINIIGAGNNYGWPRITYGINYSGSKITNDTALPGMEQPFYYWIPSIAPSGMTFVTSDLYPEWKGHLLVGSLRFQYLELCMIDNNQVVRRLKLLENIGRLRNVRQGPDGYIYVAVEGKGILKIVPN